MTVAQRRPTNVEAAARLIAVILLIVAPAFAYMQRADATGAIATLQEIQQRIPKPTTNSDSATIASAAYHAAHGAATMSGSWGATGFMTLCTGAFALGVLLLAWPIVRRRTQ